MVIEFGQRRALPQLERRRVPVEGAAARLVDQRESVHVHPAAVGRTVGVARAIGYLMALYGLAYLVQGWVAGTDGFSRAHDVLIVLAWVLNLVWMVWLVVIAWRPPRLTTKA